MKYFVLAGDVSYYQDLELFYFESEADACQFIAGDSFAHYRVIKGQELDILSTISLREKQDVQ